MKSIYVILTILAILVLGYFAFPFIIGLVKIAIGSIFVLTHIIVLGIGIYIGTLLRK